jgi:hypothetical protein
MVELAKELFFGGGGIGDFPVSAKQMSSRWAGSSLNYCGRLISFESPSRG